MRRHLPLTGIVLLAALLRLAGLGSRSPWLGPGAVYQDVRGRFWCLLPALLRLAGRGSGSLWLDEGAEYQAVRGSFGHLLHALVHTEVTPPLSYLFEWLSVQAFGTNEFAMRLPFALMGIAVVPVVYVA